MLTLALLTLLGAGSEAPKQPNILLLVADDLGNDYVNVYGEGPNYRQPPTPNLDRLARSGVWFRNAYSNPVCSSTRATLFSGRYGFRTGVGDNVKFPNEPGLLLEERTIAEVLHAAGYTCALVGKWHLGWSSLASPQYPPIAQGWQWFAGTTKNITNYFEFDWLQANERQIFPTIVERTYSPTLMTDLAIRFMNQLPEPWFITITYHGVHQPEHLPPVSLHHYGAVLDSQLRYQAMVEALDTEIGRLVHTPSMDMRRTTVCFLGDNGTAESRVYFGLDDYQRSKGSLSESGINVPLIVAGAGVATQGGESQALVNSTDIFSTLLDIAHVGAEIVPNDSVSFARVLADPTDPGRRQWVYSEVFPSVGSKKVREERTVRGPRYKLHMDDRANMFEFHDLGHADQENRTTTLLCRDQNTDRGYERCRARLNSEQRKELRRLRHVLEELQAEAN